MAYPRHHNTTGESGALLRQYVRRAVTQEEKIERTFRGMWTGWAASPERMMKWMPLGTPITSVRRAFTNLTQKGVLVKTDTKVDGSYGRSVHTWALAQPPA